MEIDSISSENFRPPRPPRGGRIDPEELFSIADENADGLLSIEEANMPDELFSNIDNDQDGLLSEDEMKSHHEAMKNKMSSMLSLLDSTASSGLNSLLENSSNKDDSFISFYEELLVEESNNENESNSAVSKLEHLKKIRTQMMLAEYQNHSLLTSTNETEESSIMNNKSLMDYINSDSSEEDNNINDLFDIIG